MDRYLLRYFLAVVDQGNFSRAAAQCNVSQPTLSVGIAKLERSFAATLFQRTSQRVELTAAGNRFLVHARRIEREYNLAHQAMTGAPGASVLRLGMLASVPGVLLARALAGSPRQEGTTLEVVTGTERELAARLAQGRLDVALTLVRDGEARFLAVPVTEEGYSLFVAADHPFAGAAQLRAQDLRDEVMIVRRHCEALSETSRFFVERGVRPRFAMRSTNDERVVQMVAARLGITMMPDSYASDGVAAVPLAGFSLRRTLGFQFAADAEPMALDLPPLLRLLADHVRQR